MPSEWEPCGHPSKHPSPTVPWGVPFHIQRACESWAGSGRAGEVCQGCMWDVCPTYMSGSVSRLCCAGLTGTVLGVSELLGTWEVLVCRSLHQCGDGRAHGSVKGCP